MFAAFAFIKAYEALEGIIVQVTCSHYVPFDYGINPKELKMESVGLIIKSNIGIMHSPVSLFARELSLVDVKIDTIHMRTTQQNNWLVYNQINRKLIYLWNNVAQFL
ncbi:hypothetical protein HZS_1554 [Henneguya salminicola]|nr:hypothetical protein HZS_1554 [Henneguya salminicola]